MGFSYTIEKKNTYNLVKVSGDFIEKEQSNVLLAAITELVSENKTNFLIDLGELVHINSTGLNVLISILTKSRKNGGDIALLNIPKKVNDLFIMTKLNGIFTIVNSIEEAEKILSN